MKVFPFGRCCIGVPRTVDWTARLECHRLSVREADDRHHADAANDQGNPAAGARRLRFDMRGSGVRKTRADPFDPQVRNESGSDRWAGRPAWRQICGPVVKDTPTIGTPSSISSRKRLRLCELPHRRRRASTAVTARSGLPEQRKTPILTELAPPIAFFPNFVLLRLKSRLAFELTGRTKNRKCGLDRDAGPAILSGPFQ